MSSTVDEMDDAVPAAEHHEEIDDVVADPDYVRSPENTRLSKETEIESSSDDEERDGRFYGPDSTWRHFTEEERALAASLDQAENNDLTIHLYNAHALKRQNLDPRLPSNPGTWHSKRRWITRYENGKSPFVPHMMWTAWPLDTADVPRHREQWGVLTVNPDVEPEVYSNPRPWKPSLILQESLEATLLRQATQRFRHRQRQEVRGKSGDTVSSSRARSSSENSWSSESSSANSKSDSGEESDEAEPEGNKPTSVDETTERYDLSFTDDDESASKILQPTVQHIISKLDHLLLGLHKSRLGHRQERSSSRGRNDSSSRSKSGTRTPSRGRASTKRKRVASDAAAASKNPESRAEEESEPETRKARSKTPKRAQHQLGARDWGEVIGMAAMTGWDQAIIDRAARRCAATFGETLQMRMIAEVPVTDFRDDTIEYAPNMISSMEQGLWSDEDPYNMEFNEDVDEISDEQAGFYCPYTDCDRHTDPYERLWRLREHLKRKHQHLNVDEEYPITKTKKRGRRRSSTREAARPVTTSVKRETEELIDGEGFESPTKATAVRIDGFLQPVTVRTTRSTDKQKRKPPASRKDTFEPRGEDYSKTSEK
ncbi:Hypothetical predicted protein [Lecanosticta acicola]|uniref:Rrn9 domain-containing protein n=1 Tax=Lecanosticta acicola TaxID=111012 RepID=A0AAI8Z7F1_9PEZI|nr:Hypothetical predicted protein [Lecanosticta acicola]